METICQIAILVCSGAVAFMVGSKQMQVRRWGFAFGLAGQPFWFWTATHHRQWAISLLAGWYTVCHIRGFWNSVTPELQKPEIYDDIFVHD